MTDWTIHTLYEYLITLVREKDQKYEQRFEAVEKYIASSIESQRSAVNSALAAAATAVQKAEVAVEKRFESVNEFRNTLKDQQSGLISRTEADAEFRALHGKINELATRLDKSEGKGLGLQAGWVILLGAITLIGGIGGIVAVVISFAR